VGRKRKRRWLAEEVKIFLAIVVICFLIAAGLHFLIIERGDLSKATDGTAEDFKRPERVMEVDGKRVDPERLRKLRETYGDRMGDAELDQLIKGRGEKINLGDLEKLRKPR